jgi:hypothetical protein
MERICAGECLNKSLPSCIAFLSLWRPGDETGIVDLSWFEVKWPEHEPIGHILYKVELGRVARTIVPRMRPTVRNNPPLIPRHRLCATGCLEKGAHS